MKIRVLAAVAAFAAAPMVANARRLDGQFAYMGMGTAPCSVWNLDHEYHNLAAANEAQVEEQWVLAFLSGVGYDSDYLDLLRGMKPTEVLLWIATYCQAHPTMKLVDAAEAFVPAHK